MVCLLDWNAAETAYEVVGMDGKVLLSGHLFPGHHTIDMRTYPAGIYLLKTQSENQLKVRRLLKQ